MVHTDTVQVWYKDKKDTHFLFSVEAVADPIGNRHIVLDKVQLATVRELIDQWMTGVEEAGLIEVTRPIEPKVPSVKPLKKRWDLTDEN